MVEPINEKIDLLDTEYAQLLDLGIDPQKYLEDSTVSSSSETALMPSKVKIAVASLVMLLVTGFLAFQILNFETRWVNNNDVTTELKARLILEMHLLQLQKLEQKSSCP